MILQHCEQVASGSQVIHWKPYWDNDQQTWVIDDTRLGYFHEPFVNGFPEVIDRLLRDLPDATSGFQVDLSDQPFPGYVHKLIRQEDEYGGHWYGSDDPCMHAWFGPVLERYFRVPPAQLFLRVEPLMAQGPGTCLREGAAMKTVQTHEAPVVHEPDADDLWVSQLLYAEAMALLEAGEHDLVLIKLDQALAHNPYHVLALAAREELCGKVNQPAR